MKTVYLAFGGNLGDAKKTIASAWEALSRVPSVKPEALSAFYVTKPWGYLDQPDFVNAAGRLQTDLSPEAVLGVCLGIEAAFGRKRRIKNGPRTLDIDVLLYEGVTRDTPELTLPHPRMWDRLFVLDPLSEVAEGELKNNVDAARSRLKREEGNR